MASAGDRGRGMGMPSSGGTGSRQENSGVSGMASAVRQTASTTARKAEEAWDEAGRQAQQLASRAGDAWEDFRGMIGRYPLAVFFAGVGIGFLLARALERWPDDVARRMSEASDH
ncbi:MAG TPA: hypothetical protein VJ739_12270 [Gemmataceae bacterium]|nr:hypothetical protein [Gemmataceae bacterium]